jgi:2-amino-4-hydroxy-6-hydroxymethyldihydropteridine diphosphokinase
MITAYIALGSNLDNPIKQLEQALSALATLPGCELCQVSPFYQNPAVGPPQPDFINAVAELHTSLTPSTLLKTLQQIEQRQGRIRMAERNTPRTLDLDIILYGKQTIHLPNLTIPHPRLYERAFVLVPLYALAPTLILPNGKSLGQCIELLGDEKFILVEIKSITSV